MMVPVEGGLIWTQDGGAGAGGRDARNGDDAVVMLHPGWGDSRIWDSLLARLPERLRVVRYDNRGYGCSLPPTVPYTQLGDLITILDQLRISRALMVGHSGGGSAAIGLALDHPDRVSALVLLAPGVDDYPWPPDDPYWREFDTALAAGDADALAKLGMRTSAPASADPEAETQIRAAAAAFLRQGEFVQPNPPAFARLAEIHVPVVLVLGDQEYPMVSKCGRTVADRIPGCQLVTVQGADHMLPLRAPELIAGLITSPTIRPPRE
jgi:3-oxoadipate enol-lactonase